MPLSGDEQRALDGIERTLRAGDPGFAADVTFDGLRRRRRLREVGAGITFVVGLAVMMIGLVAAPAPPAVSVVVSVAGVLTAVAAAGWLSLSQPYVSAPAVVGRARSPRRSPPDNV
jgi:hypothetical protein